MEELTSEELTSEQLRVEELTSGKLRGEVARFGAVTGADGFSSLTSKDSKDSPRSLVGMERRKNIVLENFISS